MRMARTALVVNINEDIFVIDCGIKYPDKTMPGIDYVIPNFDYLKGAERPCEGLFPSPWARR
jgi:ribonuclease J